MEWAIYIKVIEEGLSGKVYTEDVYKEQLIAGIVEVLKERGVQMGIYGYILEANKIYAEYKNM